MLGKVPKIAKVDRGYRARKQIGETEILIPITPKKSMSYYLRRKISQAHKKRAGIEPIIGHIKADHRLNRYFYKGIVGDNINIMLAAEAFNFKRMMNKWKRSFWHILESYFVIIRYYYLTFFELIRANFQFLRGDYLIKYATLFTKRGIF